MDTVFNDLDDILQNVYDNEYLYIHYFPNHNNNYDVYMFCVMNVYDVCRESVYDIFYFKDKIKYDLEILFDDNYANIRQLTLSINNEIVLKIQDNFNLKLSNLVNINNNKEILLGSEVKFIDFINRLLNMKIFL